MASKSSKTRSDTMVRTQLSGKVSLQDGFEMIRRVCTVQGKLSAIGIGVQGTNDSSIVSKCSTVRCGYCDDPFLRHFVAKEARRAPLINRGYYVRAKALEFTLNHFFNVYGAKRNQVVSVGCGFDSGYFRLKNQGLLENTTYIEIDFLDVAERKKRLIEDREALSEMLGDYSPSDHHREIVLEAGNYRLLGVDLTRLELLEKTLQRINVDFSVPTLFLSEVAITYMPHRSATRLLCWVAHSFENAAFMMYEQIIPNDAFGQFMQAHFNHLGSVLKSINTYPNYASQKRRCLDQGWTDAFAVDMNTFYRDFLPQEEHVRVEHLEPFDEYEEFSLKCSHYFICVATKGSCCDMSNNMNAASQTDAKTKYSEELATEEGKDNDDVQLEKTPVKISALTKSAEIDKTNPYQRSNENNPSNSVDSIQVFGHAACGLADGTVVVTGGFGEVKRKHTRWQHVVVYDMNSETMETVVPHSATDCDHQNSDKRGPTPTERLFHTATPLEGDRVLLIGGRTSPIKPGDTIYLLQLQRRGVVKGSDFSGSNAKEESKMDDGDESNSVIKTRWSCTAENIEVSGDGPAPCWRHSATRLNIEGVEQILLYGGRNAKDLILDQCFLLNTQTWTWRKVKSTGTPPGPRHSHSAVAHRDNVVISGGLDERLRPVNTVHLLDVTSLVWTEIVFHNLIPRFSHASLMVDDELVLVGGVSNECPPPGCAVVNLDSKQCVERPLPLYKTIGEHCDPIMMLHNHSALLRQRGNHGNREVVVWGGGGNCFSFGTHLNHTPVLLSL